MSMQRAPTSTSRDEEERTHHQQATSPHSRNLLQDEGLKRRTTHSAAIIRSGTTGSRVSPGAAIEKDCDTALDDAFKKVTALESVAVAGPTKIEPCFRRRPPSEPETGWPNKSITTTTDEAGRRGPDSPKLRAAP